jgi:hypothetical protein
MREQTTDLIREKARSFYGYGRWDSPFWFIGPEEGGIDSLDLRAEKWLELGRPTLCDCRQFHRCIGITKWHDPPPPLQFTWRKLMLLLHACQGKDYDNDVLRAYQRNQWGMQSDCGETCVIDLSGLPAPNGKKAKALKRMFFTQEGFDCVRNERIAYIRRKMSEKEPKVVVIFGKEQWKYWEARYWEAAPGSSFSEQTIEGFPFGIVKVESTIVAFAVHPNFARRDAYWIKVGTRIASEILN